MLGALRTYLALVVVVGHLFGPAGLGSYAVFGFYAISGYLMTLVMHNAYSYSLKGQYKFVLNRFLRLYPLFWVASLISVALILLLPSEILNYHKAMFLPDDMVGWLANITMIYPAINPNSFDPRLVPPTWALTVEITFYAMICIGLSKNFRLTQVWLAVSVVYHVYLLFSGWERGAAYYPFFAASLPFAAGAFLFHWSHRNPLTLNSKGLFIAACLVFFFSLNAVLGVSDRYFLLTGWVETTCFYVSLMLCLVTLRILTGKVDPKLDKFRKVDTALGDYSYPIYLLHFQGGIIASWLLTGDVWRRSQDLEGAVVFIASTAVTILLSWLVVTFIDAPIQSLRTKVRNV